MKASYSATAEAYAQEVVSGNIPAGKYVRLACQRHLDDLAWQSDAGFAYHFDGKAGARACKFIESLPHTKGKWAAKGERLTLEPWQVFLVMCVFGWMRKKNGLRRYRKALLLVPRKNGKSALAAGIGLYMLCADGEHGAEVYSGATTEKQAWEVFRPAKLMAQNTPALLSYFGLTPNAKNLNILGNASRFEPVIGTPGDGASPSCAIVDEYHEHPTDALFSTMETGMTVNGVTVDTAVFGVEVFNGNPGVKFTIPVSLTGRSAANSTVNIRVWGARANNPSSSSANDSRILNMSLTVSGARR